jgi:hypothetical protein
MLNKLTRDVLQQLGAINQSQIISYPVTVIKMGKSIQAFLDVSKPAPKDKDDTAKGCGEVEFDEIGTWVINELNSVINVIDNPEITNNNGTLLIKGTDNSIQYGTTPLDILESESRGDPEIIKKVMNQERNTKVLEFDLDIKNLDKIKKMSGLLKSLSDLKIESDGDNVKLMVTSKEKSSNNFTLNVTGEVNEETSMLLLMDSVNKLPNSGYKVRIFKSAKGGLVAVFNSTNVDGLDILISSKAV